MGSRTGDEQNLIIKFFSGSTIFLPLIMKMFPDVPRIFLYRNPIEVLVSNLEMPDQFWFYHPLITNSNLREVTEENTPLVNCANALSNICKHFVDTFDHNSMAINYTKLTDIKTIKKIIKHFKLSFTEIEISKMLSVTKNHSKEGQEFINDTHNKQANATIKVKNIANQILFPVYEQLEALNSKKFD